MPWHRIGSIYDIPPGERKVVEVGGRELALVHTGVGLYCIDFRCPHAGAALGAGSFDDQVIVCPQHKWRFKFEDGTHNKPPQACRPAGVYQLRAEGETLMVQIDAPRTMPRRPRREGAATRNGAPRAEAGTHSPESSEQTAGADAPPGEEPRKGADSRRRRGGEPRTPEREPESEPRSSDDSERESSERRPRRRRRGRRRRSGREDSGASSDSRE